jgi:hypothetical protein
MMSAVQRARGFRGGLENEAMLEKNASCAADRRGGPLR